MALVVLVVPDLDRLKGVDTMYMKSKFLRYYEKDFIVSSDTEELYRLSEHGREVFYHYGLKVVPWFLIQGLKPGTEEQIFLLRVAVTSIKQRLEVYMGDDVLVNVVRQTTILSKRVYHIDDPFDEMELRIKEQDKYNYLLQSKDKVTIGSIFKVTCKSPEELLPHLDEYIMKVPADLSSELKVSVMATCYLLMKGHMW